VPVLDILHSEDNLGMAGNVFRNVRDLDYPCELLCNNNHTEITKTRYVDIKTNHMFLRIDNPQHIKRIDTLKSVNLSQFAAVIISDYHKGFLTIEDIVYLSENHPLTFLDTKKTLNHWANKVSFIKINRTEYALSKPFITPELDAKIIVTLGSEGCSFRNVTYRVENVEIKNLSGAGDSFLAGLVVNYLTSNKDMSQALIAANNVATQVVQKKGVSTVKN
jgi:D-beta-D-heptose 7-phosphate kinase/D-beta-D-heptose 1-phosphate adenosyltransferase